MQTQWGQQLNPIVANPILQGVLITAIVLDPGKPKDIPTTLNRMQQGWFIVDILSDTNVWRTEPFTTNTLTLQATNETTISIWVF